MIGFHSITVRRTVSPYFKVLCLFVLPCTKVVIIAGLQVHNDTWCEALCACRFSRLSILNRFQHDNKKGKVLDIPVEIPFWFPQTATIVWSPTTSSYTHCSTIMVSLLQWLWTFLSAVWPIKKWSIQGINVSIKEEIYCICTIAV